LLEGFSYGGFYRCIDFFLRYRPSTEKAIGADALHENVSLVGVVVLFSDRPATADALWIRFHGRLSRYGFVLLGNLSRTKFAVR
jgi:hypothetical protein